MISRSGTPAPHAPHAPHASRQLGTESQTMDRLWTNDGLTMEQEHRPTSIGAVIRAQRDFGPKEELAPRRAFEQERTTTFKP